MATTFRPDADLAEQLRIAAFQTGRSQHSIIYEAVRHWLKLYNSEQPRQADQQPRRTQP